MFERLENRLHHWLHHSFPASPDQLAIYRICFATYLLLFGVPRYVWISDIPQMFFKPGPVNLSFYLSLVGGFPGEIFFDLLSIILYPLAIFLFFGLFTRTVSMTLGILVIVGNSFAYSFGKIDHDILIWLVPIVMSASRWGDRYSFDHTFRRPISENGNSTWPVTLLSLMLGFAMFSAGIPKLLGGWLNLGTQAVRGHLYYYWFVLERRDLLAPFFMQLDNWVVWEIMDYAAVVFELGFLVSVSRAGWFKAFVASAVVFHVLNYLILNITFSSYLIVYLVFLDWSKVHGWIQRKRIDRFLERFVMRIPSMVVLVGVYFILFSFTPAVKSRWFVPLWFASGTMMEMIKLFLGLVVVAAIASSFVLGRFRQPKTI